MDQFLSKYLSAGDFLLDLAWNIDANDIIGWAHDHGVIYLNTSLELWDPLMSRNDLFKGWNGRIYDESDPWQFSNFLA